MYPHFSRFSRSSRNPAGETATAADGMHLTGIRSCKTFFNVVNACSKLREKTLVNILTMITLSSRATPYIKNTNFEGRGISRGNQSFVELVSSVQ